MSNPRMHVHWEWRNTAKDTGWNSSWQRVHVYIHWIETCRHTMKHCIYCIYIYITMQNLELPQSVQSNDITELHLKTSCQTSQARFCHLRPTQMKAFSRQWLFDRGLWLPALPPSEFTWKPKNDSVFASWGHGIQVFKWLFFSRFHD